MLLRRSVYSPHGGTTVAGTSTLSRAAYLALGFFFGARLGAYGAVALHAEILRKVFGVQLLLIALHMIFAKHGT
jgi:uncharacterized membrane protein YfcA